MQLAKTSGARDGAKREAVRLIGFTMMEMNRVREIVSQPLPEGEDARAAQRRLLFAWRRWMERLGDRVRERIEALR